MYIMNSDDFRRELKKGLSGGYLFFGDEDYLKANALLQARAAVCPEEAFAFFENVRALPNLSILGWLTMGPNVEGEEIRPYFRQTKAIFDTVATRYGYDTETPILSMGMSDSFGVAIEEGSTLVRVGRRLFLK